MTLSPDHHRRPLFYKFAYNFSEIENDKMDNLHLPQSLIIIKATSLRSCVRFLAATATQQWQHKD